MRQMKQISLLGVFLAVLLGFSGPAGAQCPPTCGPGDHWIDTCESDTKILITRADLTLDIDLDNVGDLDITLIGPTVVFWGDPIDTPDPLDPGHNNQLDSEMVSMNLVGDGFILNAGDGIGNNQNDGPLHSPGTIIEQPGNPALADNCFSVFFEILNTPFGRLHNNTGALMAATIDRMQPVIGTTYPGANLPFPLFDDNNVLVAQIVDNAAHTIQGCEEEIPTVSEWGLIIMALLALTAGTIVFARRRRPAVA